MPSQLYNAAVAALNPEAGPKLDYLTMMLDWLLRSGGPVGGPIYANVQAESHLTGNQGYGHAAEYQDFLTSIGTAHAQSAPADQVESYEGATQAFIKKGLVIPRIHLPNELLRYCMSRRMAVLLIERILGPDARNDADAGVFTLQELFSRVQQGWRAEKLENGDNLSRGEIVWATYEIPAGTPAATTPE